MDSKGRDKKLQQNVSVASIDGLPDDSDERVGLTSKQVSSRGSMAKRNCAVGSFFRDFSEFGPGLTAVLQ